MRERRSLLFTEEGRAGKQDLVVAGMMDGELFIGHLLNNHIIDFLAFNERSLVPNEVTRLVYIVLWSHVLAS